MVNGKGGGGGSNRHRGGEKVGERSHCVGRWTRGLNVDMSLSLSVGEVFVKGVGKDLIFESINPRERSWSRAVLAIITKCASYFQNAMRLLAIVKSLYRNVMYDLLFFYQQNCTFMYVGNKCTIWPKKKKTTKLSYVSHVCLLLQLFIIKLLLCFIG